MSEASVPDYVLPASLIGHADLSRLIREIESVEGAVQAQKVRDAKAKVHLPNLSQSLSDFFELNSLEPTDSEALLTLKDRLRVVKDHAPVVHMTFATEVDPEQLEGLVTWLRQEVHPYALVTIGLQPSLVGGVYLRTPNKVYDFSIKSLLAGKRDIVMKELEALHAR